MARKQKISTVINSIVTNYGHSNVYDELLEKVAEYHGFNLEELKRKLKKRYKQLNKEK